MKKQFLSMAIASTLLWSCSNNNKSQKNTDASLIDTATAKDPKTVVDAHNAKTSLDWNGTYKGITPCADCEGIETEVTLNKDMTFIVKTTYKGKSDKVFEEKGSFKWDATGSKISLEGLKDRPSQFFVGENTLTQLDLEGNRITGALAENYILKK
ncbi:copper resistance protein NlpE [Pedobacter foliorum]|uniref:copper resistance protein NlpE n=1 Tax=Pedobacter foliorum TaxID=2739058 RepID=UPI0015640651|nr:copper resistance protein NlpE [Pedobacter foliorum]NRF38919.1 copper resistance protein NlpE N-terminal domain-containing protein [Pedobacter foliorum]